MMRPTHELLYDSEASLRLVDRAIGDLSPARTARSENYADTAAIVVRYCQGAGLLDAGRLRALQNMPWRIGNSSPSVDATPTDVLDELNRAAALVDALEDTEGVSDEMRRDMTNQFLVILNSALASA